MRFFIPIQLWTLSFAVAVLLAGSSPAAAGQSAALKTPVRPTAVLQTAGPASISKPQKELLSILFQPAGEFDLAETLFLVSKDWDSAVRTDSLRTALDGLIDAFKRERKDSSSPQETIDALRRVIHQEGGYRFSDRVDPQGIPADPEELFIHGLLQNKRGYCMNLSLLYLIVADRLDLPLFGVPLPNHFFVRYDSGTFRANIEATQGGESYPDSFYRRGFGVPSGGGDYFLKNLSKKQTLGAYFNNVGMVLYRQGRAADALFYLQNSVAINPGAMDAHNNLANIYAEQDKNELAIEQYKKAIQVDPNNFSTYFNLGLALAATGRDKKALEAFLQAAQLNPTYTPVHSALARLYLKTQNWAGALAHFTVLSELEPQVLGHWMQIARVYLQMGEPRLALSSLQETQRQFPTRLSVNELMAEAHFRLKEMDAAATQLEYLIERAPQASQQAYIQLGWIRYLQTRVDEAVQWTKKSLDLAKNPQLTVLGQMNLGLYHLVQGKFEEGETWYKKALAAPNEKILPALVQDLEEARQRYPDNQELIFYQGWAYAQAGKPKLAAPPLKRYLADNPQGVRAAKARQLLGRTGTAEKPRASVEGMVLVTKGFFVMGSNQHAKDEAPEHRVFLEAYYIDLTEVTAAEFAGFLNTLPGPAMSARYFNRGKRATVGFDEKRFFARPGLEDLPANKVTWYGADAYCRWRDKRLPTEAEWEKAARGIDGRIYPWGDEPPTPERARFLQKWTDETEHRVMLPVRTLPQSRSPFGLFHMAGNLKEWVDDWYDREYYKEEQHKVNPKGQVGGEYKVLKGGSWRDLKSFLYSSFRNNSYPRSGLDDYGFRCAKSEDGAPAPGRLTGRHVPVPVASLQPQQLTIDDWRH